MLLAALTCPDYTYTFPYERLTDRDRDRDRDTLTCKDCSDKCKDSKDHVNEVNNSKLQKNEKGLSFSVPSTRKRCLSTQSEWDVVSERSDEEMRFFNSESARKLVKRESNVCELQQEITFLYAQLKQANSAQCGDSDLQTMVTKFDQINAEMTRLKQDAFDEADVPISADEDSLEESFENDDEDDGRPRKVKFMLQFNQIHWIENDFQEEEDEDCVEDCDSVIWYDFDN